MKYLGGGIAFVVATVLVVLLIRHETNSMQATIKQTAREAVEESVERSPETAIQAVGKSVGRVLNPSAGPDEERPKSADEPPKSADERPRSGEKSPSSSGTTAAPESTSKREPAESIDPVGIVGSLFESGRRAAKAADDIGQQVLPLDDQQETEIGAEVHQLILRNHKVLDNPQQSVRIRRLAEPVIAECKRKAIHYSFTLIDDPTVNAYSHAGGYIYVHRGLFELLTSDAELQFALGHEIGHVELKHCVRGLNYAAQLGKWNHAVVGQLAQAAYHLIALGYNEDLEFEADEFAFRKLIRVGRSKDEALGFSRHYLKYAREKGMETGNRKPASVPGAVVQEIENHFKSHPPAEDRLRRLEDLKL